MRSVWSEAEAEALESPVFAERNEVKCRKKPPEFKNLKIRHFFSFLL